MLSFKTSLLTASVNLSHSKDKNHPWLSDRGSYKSQKIGLMPSITHVAIQAFNFYSFIFPYETVTESGVCSSVVVAGSSGDKQKCKPFCVYVSDFAARLQTRHFKSSWWQMRWQPIQVWRNIWNGRRFSPTLTSFGAAGTTFSGH